MTNRSVKVTRLRGLPAVSASVTVTLSAVCIMSPWIHSLGTTAVGVGGSVSTVNITPPGLGVTAAVSSTTVPWGAVWGMRTSVSPVSASRQGSLTTTWTVRGWVCLVTMVTASGKQEKVYCMFGAVRSCSSSTSTILLILHIHLVIIVEKMSLRPLSLWQCQQTTHNMCVYVEDPQTGQI